MVVEQEDGSKQRQEPIFKHFCRVCKRGFGCAGALGGHMRSHGVGEVRWNNNSGSHRGGGSSSHDDDDDDKQFGISNFRRDGESTKHSYFLRTNTNRFTTSFRPDTDQKRPFAGAGRHGRFSSPAMSSSESEIEHEANLMNNNNIKSRTPKSDHYASSEEEDLAANCLVMLSNRSFVLSDNRHKVEKAGNLFQCKACKKVFNSHQALGGHRASHKKVKGCYASRFNAAGDETAMEEEQEEADFISGRPENENSSDPAGIVDLDFSPHRHRIPDSSNHNTTSSKSKSKAHQCSICQRVFSSGQALGGHKRCHWLTSNLPDNTIIQNLQDFNFDNNPQQNLYNKKTPPPAEAASLDLNFPLLLNNNNAVDNRNAGSCYSNDLFNYEAPTRTFLQLWGNEAGDKKHDFHYLHPHQQQQRYVKTKSVVHENDSSKKSEEEEQDRRMKKIAKLSDLKDSDGGWLQMGIASSTTTQI